MNRSFKSLFLITFVLSFALLVLGERLVLHSNQTEHIIGWALVALFIAALIGITFKKGTAAH